MFDLRPLYAFDSSEGQIPEGFASVYGPANSHANCVPASFTAALALAGFGDIDPQRLTNEIYGPNYRGGFGNFSKTIAWIKANVPSAPAFSDKWASRITSAEFAPCWTPRPSHVGHQPRGLLNEKWCGFNGSKLRPQRSQAKCWL